MIHFCSEAMQRAFAVRPQVDLYAHKVVAQLTEQASTVVETAAEERGARRAALTSAQVVHSRFGVTVPKVFKALASSAVGVELRGKDCYTKYMSLAYAQQASFRSSIRHSALPSAPPGPGHHASMDFTRAFERDVDGHVYALVFLDVATFMLWACPLKDKSGAEAARALCLYREHVRSTFGTELLHLRADSDPSFAVSGHGEARVASALRHSLAATSPVVQLSFSPPYCQAMNPVENAVRHAYYLLNFFLAQAYLSMLAWCDMLLASVHVLNTLPRPQSRHVELRTKSPVEMATGAKPDMPRQLRPRDSSWWCIARARVRARV
jgi:hypothetical protein